MLNGVGEHFGLQLYQTAPFTCILFLPILFIKLSHKSSILAILKAIYTKKILVTPDTGTTEVSFYHYHNVAFTYTLP